MFMPKKSSAPTTTTTTKACVSYIDQTKWKHENCKTCTIYNTKTDDCAVQCYIAVPYIECVTLFCICSLLLLKNTVYSVLFVSNRRNELREQQKTILNRKTNNNNGHDDNV